MVGIQRSVSAVQILKPIKALLIGSRVYGYPDPGTPYTIGGEIVNLGRSDIDMVVLLSEQDAALLRTMSDGQGNPMAHGQSMRFGELNLIVVTDSNKFDAWKSGTQFLKAIKPVTKVMACMYFDTVFKAFDAQ